MTDVASTEGLVLESSTGIGLIRRAKEECQNILSRFTSFSGLSPSDLTTRDVNLPLFAPSDIRYNNAGFAQLVVTGDTEAHWSAIKAWVAAKTLLKVYRACTNKNSDRYSDRFEALMDQIRETEWPNLKRRGLPIIFNPLVAPGALQERAGLFTTSNLSLVAGPGTLDATSREFAITWVGNRYVSATEKFNQESGRSARVSLPMVNGDVARVSIAGLTPPNGQQPEFTRSSSRYSPGVAVGWNVWAGLVGGTMYRQNILGVLPLSQTTYTLLGNPVLSGEELGLGQYEDVVLEVSMELVRC